MSYIAQYIDKLNANNRKALSVFLTAGFPTKDTFMEVAKGILDAGADMLEIGMPFSDPLADGPVIQESSKLALEQGIDTDTIFDYVQQLRQYTDKPLILMGYANPILQYGKSKFASKVKSSGANGLIIPDIPIEEYETFIANEFDGIDIVLLTTPVSSDERITAIDTKSSGFVYCVSVTGTTGMQKSFNDETLNNLNRTYQLITNNKMMIGFGISTPENVKTFVPYCDGVIVGSAVIKSLLENGESFSKTYELVNSLSDACNS